MARFAHFSPPGHVHRWEALAKKIPLHPQLADLGVQLLDLACLLGSIRFDLGRENPGHTLKRIMLAGMDYRLMHAALRHRAAIIASPRMASSANFALKGRDIGIAFASYVIRHRLFFGGKFSKMLGLQGNRHLESDDQRHRLYSDKSALPVGRGRDQVRDRRVAKLNAASPVRGAEKFGYNDGMFAAKSAALQCLKSY